METEKPTKLKLIKYGSVATLIFNYMPVLPL